MSGDLSSVVNSINAIGTASANSAAIMVASMNAVSKGLAGAVSAVNGLTIAIKVAPVVTAPGATTTGTVTSGPNDTLTRLINGLANYPGGKP